MTRAKGLGVGTSKNKNQTHFMTRADGQGLGTRKQGRWLITDSKVKACLDTVRQRQYQEKVEQEKWQGKLMKNRWDDNNLGQEGCFAWLHHWKRHLRLRWHGY